MGNKRKVSNSTVLVESEVVHHQSHEPKVALDKNRFVSVEAHMFYDKLALISSPCLERDATVGNDTIVREFAANTHKLTGTVFQVKKRSVNFSREVINAYYQILNIDESKHSTFKRSDINYDMLLRELCDPHVLDGMAKCEFYPTREHKQFLKTWLSPYALVWYHFLTSRILPITHLTKVTQDRVVLLYVLVKGWSIDIGLEIQMEILHNGTKDQPNFSFPNLITSLCTKADVTLRIGSKISPDKPITGLWIRLTLKKHDKSLQDLIAKQQLRRTWELPPPAHPDYEFRRPRTEVELHSLAVYHSWSLHTLHRKLDILAHQLHPAQPLDLPNWPLEPEAPSWHFGPPADDEYGLGSEESEDEYADHVADDEVGPLGCS
ncbi:hypothetical protein ACH5RR_023241 [Cinchona calisaya]|uniref:Putative plant transposon protein domain-containing protein n=1 Tax=Cinchona calisaya TaxID=153742 RepID=A0ABD2ZBM3_9GENT